MRPETNIQKHPGGRATRPPKIVMVDDEPLLLELAEVVTRAWSKEVTLLCFQDGATAWEELLRADPDLLITDMNRDGMSGWKMLPLLAAKKVKYPILVHSGNATEDEVRLCTGPNLNVTFLGKPWEAQQFCEQLSVLLGDPRP